MFPSNRMYNLPGAVAKVHGYGAMRGMPVGKQFASGSSLATRWLINFSAEGSSGIFSPSGKPTAKSERGPPPIQIPEKSGLPSVSRGADPRRFATPLGARFALGASCDHRQLPHTVKIASQ